MLDSLSEYNTNDRLQGGMRYKALTLLEHLMSAKFFCERFPFGLAGLQLARYIDWVDDYVDLRPNEGEIDFEKDRIRKIGFVDRQISLIDSFGRENPSDVILTEGEKVLMNLPWQEMPGEVKDSAIKLLETIRDDAAHLGLNPRSEEVLRQNFVTSMICIAQIVSLLSNGREIVVTRGLENLAYWWVLKDSLNDIREDLESGLIRLPLPDEIIIKLNQIRFEERLTEIKTYLTPERLNKMRRQTLDGMLSSLGSIWKVNVPFFQRFMVINYLLYIIGRNKVKIIKEV